MTDDERGILALDVHAARPDWDTRGILTALRRIPNDVDPARIRAAALTAARNPTNRTPAVIPLDGPHWHDPTPPPTPAGRTPRCPVHDLTTPCISCAADQLLTGARRPSTTARIGHHAPAHALGVPMPDHVRALIPRQE